MTNKEKDEKRKRGRPKGSSNKTSKTPCPLSTPVSVRTTQKVNSDVENEDVDAVVVLRTKTVRRCVGKQLEYIKDEYIDDELTQDMQGIFNGDIELFTNSVVCPSTLASVFDTAHHNGLVSMMDITQYLLHMSNGQKPMCAIQPPRSMLTELINLRSTYDLPTTCIEDINISAHDKNFIEACFLYNTDKAIENINYTNFIFGMFSLSCVLVRILNTKLCCDVTNLVARVYLTDVETRCNMFIGIGVKYVGETITEDSPHFQRPLLLATGQLVPLSQASSSIYLVNLQSTFQKRKRGEYREGDDDDVQHEGDDDDVQHLDKMVLDAAQYGGTQRFINHKKEDVCNCE